MVHHPEKGWRYATKAERAALANVTASNKTEIAQPQGEGLDSNQRHEQKHREDGPWYRTKVGDYMVHHPEKGWRYATENERALGAKLKVSGKPGTADQPQMQSPVSKEEL